MHDTITHFFTKIIGETVKKLLLLELLCNIVMARPPHEITVITRPVSPLMSDLELDIRVSQLIKERRNCLVRSEDSTLIAILEVIKMLMHLQLVCLKIRHERWMIGIFGVQ